MVMMGLELTDQLPLHTVYLHALDCDTGGRKISKLLGNIIDPLHLPVKEVVKAKKDQEKDFLEGIPKCDPDALRFGLLSYTVQGWDVNFDI